jgi:hypothetical protein
VAPAHIACDEIHGRHGAITLRHNQQLGKPGSIHEGPSSTTAGAGRETSHRAHGASRKIVNPEPTIGVQTG